MPFNSIDFGIFLPLVFAIYWFVVNRNIRIQNSFVVLASYLFYSWWDWRFLTLMIISTLVDFIIGRELGKESGIKARKVLLWVSIVVNIGLLAFFKYYNFFIQNFILAFSFFGNELDIRSLNIILPVGISFYTFQTLSYTVEVYKRKLKPTQDFIAFAAFVSFFPQLVAGPIERASNLLPQFNKKRTFNYAEAFDGMRQILWGFFKKVVVADSCAVYVNNVFGSSDYHSGSTLILAAVLFAFQIYGDFSGYSDIAIGTSRLFGFNLRQNFAFPFFSRDIAEFWRRWHISLSTWFRDHLYIPLGGSRGSTNRHIRNIIIVFVVSGLWHGASWNFIVWGALHATLYLPLLLMRKTRTHLSNVAQGRYFPNLREVLSMSLTFMLTTLAWIVFRSETLLDAIHFISNTFDKSVFSVPYLFPGTKKTLVCILILLAFEWVNRENRHGLQLYIERYKLSRISYYVLLAIILQWGAESQSFIYFQF